MSDFLSLTELGQLYGVSSHKVGRWLKNLGWRTEDGRPSSEAFQQNLVGQRESRQPGTFFYVWSAQETISMLDDMGYPRANGERPTKEANRV